MRNSAARAIGNDCTMRINTARQYYVQYMMKMIISSIQHCTGNSISEILSYNGDNCRSITCICNMIKWSSTELDSDTHTNTVFTEHWLGSFQQLVHSGLACAKGDVTTLELTHKQDHDNVHPLFHPFSPPSLSALPSLCNASYNTGHNNTIQHVFQSGVCLGSLGGCVCERQAKSELFRQLYRTHW